METHHAVEIPRINEDKNIITQHQRQLATRLGLGHSPLSEQPTGSKVGGRSSKVQSALPTDPQILGEDFEPFVRLCLAHTFVDPGDDTFYGIESIL